MFPFPWQFRYNMYACENTYIHIQNHTQHIFTVPTLLIHSHPLWESYYWFLSWRAQPRLSHETLVQSYSQQVGKTDLNADHWDRETQGIHMANFFWKKSFMLYFDQFEHQIHLTEFNCKLLYSHVITDLTALMIFVELRFKVINIFNHHI